MTSMLLVLHETEAEREGRIGLLQPLRCALRRRPATGAMNNAAARAAGPHGSTDVRIPAPCRSSRGRGGQSGVRAGAEGMARKSMCVSCSMRRRSSRSRGSAACSPSSTPRDMGSTRRRSRRASTHCRCPPSAKYARSLPCLAAKFKSESFVQQCGGKSGDACKSTGVVSFLSVRQWRRARVHAADISHWDAALQQVHVYCCREKAGFQPRHNSWIDEGPFFRKVLLVHGFSQSLGTWRINTSVFPSTLRSVVTATLTLQISPHATADSMPPLH
ncbi:uncharacterized protein [Miscanthus floridulus]|uniref:uncharacterized protein isoform X2 n=1 Tax=Miscanthus floridulus TaxID=154761 RepID=UPI003458608E